MNQHQFHWPKNKPSRFYKYSFTTEETKNIKGAPCYVKPVLNANILKLLLCLFHGSFLWKKLLRHPIYINLQDHLHPSRLLIKRPKTKAYEVLSSKLKPVFVVQQYNSLLIQSRSDQNTGAKIPIKIMHTTKSRASSIRDFLFITEPFYLLPTHLNNRILKFLVLLCMY